MHADMNLQTSRTRSVLHASKPTNYPRTIKNAKRSLREAFPTLRNWLIPRSLLSSHYIPCIRLGIVRLGQWRVSPFSSTVIGWYRSL